LDFLTDFECSHGLEQRYFVIILGQGAATSYKGANW